MSDAATTNAVDLSRMPAPEIVEQLSYEDILAAHAAEAVSRLAAKGIAFDPTIESDPAVIVLQVGAYRELLVRQDFNDRGRQVMVAYATKGNLENLGALVSVPRLVVTPANPDTGAPAVLEDDESYRRRIVLAPEAFTVAGPESAYIFHALSTNGRIADASVTSPSPKHVLVTLLADYGDGTAHPAMIAQVQARLASAPLRPLTDLVTVASASIVTFVIEAVLTIFDGPDAVLIESAARASLDVYLAKARKLGRDITRAGIIAALMVEGVQNVALAAPAADVVIDPTEVGNCAGITLSVAGRDE